MKLLEVFKLAIEALYANKLRAALTMLGMIIGVGAVVLLVSIGNGAKNYITGEFEGLGTNLIMIQPGKRDAKSSMGPPVSSVKRKMTLRDAEAVQRGAYNLEASTGIMFGTGTVETPAATKNLNLMGSNEQLPRIFNIVLMTGQFYSQEEDQAGRRVIVLGFTVARDLFGETNPIGQLVKVNESEFRVIGVTRKAGEKLGFNMDEIAYLPTKAAMRIFNEDKLFGLRARAKSKASMDDAVAEVTNILKERHNGEEDFTVLTQVSMMETMDTILNMLTYVLAGIAMISMIVGGIGIMNIMLVSVTERTREIGIRRAVGARQADILKQFLVEAVTLSVIGGLVGVSGSVLVTFLVSKIFPSFDMTAPFWILPPAFLLSTVTGIVFGVWPARKASRIETIEALRFE